MNKLIVVFTFIVSATFCSAQVFVGGKDLKEIDVQYIYVNATEKGKETYLVLDIGQGWVGGQDETGKNLSFRSELEVINYLYKNGWIYESRFVNKFNFPVMVFSRGASK